MSPVGGRFCPWNISPIDPHVEQSDLGRQSEDDDEAFPAV